MNIMVHVPAGAQGQQGNFKPHSHPHRNSLLSSPICNGSDGDVLDDVYEPEGPRRYQPTSTHTYCYGLPYQDHNYGAPPPPTPPASPPPVATTPNHSKLLNGHIDIEDISGTTEVTTTEVTEDSNINQDDSVTRCICEFQHDDGYMICCDKCSVWQHVDCMGVDRSNIPDKYLCELCEPRKVDKSRAVALQIKKRQEIAALDTSATETEDETIKLGINTGPLKKTKTRRKRKERDKPDKVSRKSKKDGEDKKVRKIKTINQQTPGRRKSQSTLRKIVNARKSPKSPRSPRSPKSLAPNMSANLSEDALDSWNASSSKPLDTSTNSNHYSLDMQRIMASKKFNGQHSTVGGSKPWEQLLVQLCQLSPVKPNRKGLEAATDIVMHQPIIEYKGKVMLREQYEKENLFLKNQPFVLFYSKFEGLDLCVDASVFGNDARYIRRSCTPNAEVQHVVENGKVRFYVYSSKGISQGTEVTIPFDFSYKDCNYEVECACSRPSCPIAKAYKKANDGQLRSRKRRRTLSTDQKSGAVTVAETSSSRSMQGGGSKRRRSAPTSDASPTPVLKHDEHSRGARGSQSSQHASDSQSELLVSPVKSTPMSPGSSSQPLPSGSPEEPESAEAAERRKKMTREERKMEAIMKAFEKLEKREERRREALARMDHKKPGTKPDKPEPTTPTKEPEPVPEEKKEEAPPPPPPEPKPEPKMRILRGKKKKVATPARRKSRLGSSTSNTADALSSADESSNQAAPTPTSAAPLNSQVMPASGENSNPNTPSSSTSGKAFRFPKTKKHMMNEWLNEKSQDPTKPLTIKTELLEVNTSITEDSAEFVRCMPSPHTNSLSHLRRHSMSGCSQTKTVATTAVAAVNELSLGSAKKRWLRQAMYERTTSLPHSSCSPSGSISPVQSGGMSPNPNIAPQAHSPASSPIDFVTPLKKRRLARESLSQDAAGQGTPGNSGNGQQEGMMASTPLDQGISEGERSASDNEEMSPAQLPNGIRPHHLSPIIGMPVSHLLLAKEEKDMSEDGKVNQESRDSSLSESQVEDGAQPSADSGFKSHMEVDETTCSSISVDDDNAKETPSNLALTNSDSLALPDTASTSVEEKVNIETSMLDSETAEQTSSSTDAVSNVKDEPDVSDEQVKSENVNEVVTSYSEQEEASVKQESSNEANVSISEENETDINTAPKNCSSEAELVESSADIKIEAMEQNEPKPGTSSEVESCSQDVLSKSFEDGEIRDSNDSMEVEQSETCNEAISTSDRDISKGCVVTAGVCSQTDAGTEQNGGDVSCSNSQSPGVSGPASGDIEVHSSGANLRHLDTSMEEGELTAQSSDEETVTHTLCKRNMSRLTSIEENSSSNLVSSSSGRYDASKSAARGLSPRSPRVSEGLSPRSEHSSSLCDSNQGVDSTWQLPYDSAVDLDVSSSSSSCKPHLHNRLTNTNTEQSGPTSSEMDSPTKTGPLDLDSQGVSSSWELSPTPDRTNRTLSSCLKSVSLENNSQAETSPPSASSSSVSTSSHPTNTVHPEPCCSTSGKKKVSLLEYRKRMKQRSSDGGSRGNSLDGHTPGSTSSGPSSPRSAFLSSLAPLPLFNSSSSFENDRTMSDVTSSRRVMRGKDDQDVRWSSPLKTATPLSLTERLRREFGVDASESEDDDDKESTPIESPPPPPPPPPRHLNNGPGLYQGSVMVGMGAVASPGHRVVVGQPPPPPPPPRRPPPPPPPAPPGRAVPVAPQRPSPPAATPGRPIPSLMSINSYPTKPFTSQLLPGQPAAAAAGPPPPPPPHPSGYAKPPLPQQSSYPPVHFTQGYTGGSK